MTTINDGIVVHILEEVVKEENKSCGNPFQDYNQICERLNIVPCPFVRFSERDGTRSCKIMNCILDVPSFRAALITLAVADKPFTELVFHGVQLRSENFVDIKTVLEKRHGMLSIVKFDYSTFPESSFSQVVSVMSSGPLYISLRACGLDDNFLSLLAESLGANPFLQAINLSENLFTDEGVNTIFHALMFNVAVKHITLKRNNLSGSCLDSLKALLIARTCTPDDLTEMKHLAKAFADRNKALKDVNKARKAAGQPDILEVNAPESRIFKIGPEQFIANRSMAFVDLSFNSFAVESIRSMLEQIAQRDAAVTGDKLGGTCSTAIALKGLQISESDRRDLKAIDIGRGISVQWS